MIVTSCASQPYLQKLDEAMHQYAGLIRWSNFEDAAQFHQNIDPVKAAELAKRLKNVQVTSYVEKSRYFSPEKSSAYQDVEIRYFDKNVAREKVLLDKQEWHFDESSGRWLLKTPLPKFEVTKN
jgi:hypothetical protein